VAAHTFRVAAPARVHPMGVDLARGSGGPAASAPVDSPAATQATLASSPSSNPLDAVSSAWAGFLASGVASAQVALGAALVGVALLILVSQTSAGAAAGRGAAGGARRALRFVPVVGALA
jgi:hypothetical protein